MTGAAIAMLSLVACGGQSTAGLKSTAPSGDYGPPPAGVPLFYIGDTAHAGWYVGFDWSGHPRGTIKLQQRLSGGLAQAPDGSAFAYSSSGKGMGFDQYLDRLGRPIADADHGSFASTTWSDDSSRVCTLDFNDRQWHVGLKTPGALSITHVVAIPDSVVQSGIIGMSVAACNPVADRAILLRSYWGKGPQIWLVKLSDGTVVAQRTYPAYALADVVASLDGVLVAENSSKSAGYVKDGAAQHTVIRRVVDGSVALDLDPGYEVLAFSDNDSVALVTTSPWVSGQPTHLALVRLADGKVPWRSGADTEYGGRWIQPHGSGIAVALQSPGSSRTAAVLILHGDGTSRALDRLP